MKTLLTLLVCILAWQHLPAQIQGPLSGATFTTVAIAGSNKTWTSPGNVDASDNVYASFGNLTGGVGSYTDYLVTTNFGFSIPSGSIISGIIVESERADPNFRTADYSVRIVKAGIISTTERSVGSGYPSSDSYQSYGNAGDLWGETWSDADINDPGFGVAIAARRSVSGGTTAGRVDHIRIIVFYDFNTLPIHLLDFSGTKKEHSVLLKWVTSGENNMSHYELQRSTNGFEYYSIASIASRNQAIETTYTAIDQQPPAGRSFYRLKTVENTGTIKYSKIISVEGGSQQNFRLYPTAWKQGTALFIDNPGNTQLRIIFYAGSGQVIRKITTNANQLPPDQSATIRGKIFYQVIGESGEPVGSGILFAF